MIGNAVSLHLDGESGSQQSAFEYLFPFIAGITSEIRRDSFINAAANGLGADPASVRNDFERFLKKGASRKISAKEETPAAFLPSSDAELIAALVANEDLFEVARAEIGPADFNEEPLKDAFIVMEECFRGGILNVASVTDRLTSEGLKTFILQKVSDGAYAINPERFVVDGVRGVKERALERRKERIVARIREYDEVRDGDEISLNDLMYEKMFLDGELTRIKEERHGRP